MSLPKEEVERRIFEAVHSYRRDHERKQRMEHIKRFLNQLAATAVTFAVGWILGYFVGRGK